MKCHWWEDTRDSEALQFALQPLHLVQISVNSTHPIVKWIFVYIFFPLDCELSPG